MIDSYSAKGLDVQLPTDTGSIVPKFGWRGWLAESTGCLGWDLFLPVVVVFQQLAERITPAQKTFWEPSEPVLACVSLPRAEGAGVPTGIRQFFGQVVQSS